MVRASRVAAAIGVWLAIAPVRADDVQPQARVPLLTDAQVDPAVAGVFAAIRSGGSEPLDMHRAVANAPGPFIAYVGLARALRQDAQIPRPLRELAIIRTLQVEGGTYELEQHTAMAVSCGLTSAQVAAVSTWRTRDDLFGVRQRAVLAWAEAMATASGPDDATDATLARYFSPREVVEITLTAAFYAASARTTKALAIRPDRRAATSAGPYGGCR